MNESEPTHGWFRTGLEEAREALHNRLEPAALELVPELARWREFLDRAGAGHFRLAGSGASFFGLFADEGAGKEALEQLSIGAKDRDLGLRCGFTARPAGTGVSLVASK